MGKAYGSHKSGVMNGTEKLYAKMLELQKAAGMIKGYWFEAMTFKLADDTRYTPDFMVQMMDDEIEFHEVKGRWMDDAKVKIKIAATMFPFVFKSFIYSGRNFEEKDWTVK